MWVVLYSFYGRPAVMDCASHAEALYIAALMRSTDLPTAVASYVHVGVSSVTL